MSELLSWTNFWVARRKIKERDKIILVVSFYYGMTPLAFYKLPLPDQDRLIDQYKKLKALP